MSVSDRKILRGSLAVVWLVTAIVSLWEFNGYSMELLTKAGVSDRNIAGALIVAGAGSDLMIGVAIALWPSRRVYLQAMGLMLTMTAVATALNPSLWLHPLGPLTKNVPITAALWILIRGTK